MTREFNGYTFRWGPNKYYVRHNHRGVMVWSRCSARNGFPKHVDHYSRSDSKFARLLHECAELVESES